MVTSKKIYESIMGNRGSKSNILNIFVKEQRADASSITLLWLSASNCKVCSSHRETGF